MSASRAGFSLLSIQACTNHCVSIPGKYEPNYARNPRHIYTHYISMEINTFILFLPLPTPLSLCPVSLNFVHYTFFSLSSLSLISPLITSHFPLFPFRWSVNILDIYLTHFINSKLQPIRCNVP